MSVKKKEFKKLEDMMTQLHETESTDPLEIENFLQQRSLCEVVWDREEVHQFCLTIGRRLHSAT